MQIALKIIYTLIITGILSFSWIKIFKYFKLLDRPGNDIKNTRKPVPTIQGVFAYLAFILCFCVISPEYIFSPLFLGLVLGSLPIFLVELIEELWYMWRLNFRIPPIVRLCVHILSSLLAIYISGIGDGYELLINGVAYQIPMWWFLIFFVVWSMFCINAINRVDGVYGQASWVSGIGFLTIYLLIKFVVLQGYAEIYNIETLNFIQDASLVMWIICLIYTFIEFKPLALVRDVGIMFFGFALAYLSVLWGAKIGTVVVALSLVIFDAIWVGLYRIFILKKSPMQWDYTHLHHRLLWLGRNKSEIRVFVRGRSLVMMILMLLQGTDRLNKIIIFVLMAIIFFGVNGYLFLIKKLPCGLDKTK